MSAKETLDVAQGSRVTGSIGAVAWRATALVLALLLVAGYFATRSDPGSARADATRSTHQAIVLAGFQSLSRVMEEQAALPEQQRSLTELEGGARLGDPDLGDGGVVVTTRSIEQTPDSIVTKMTVTSDGFTTVAILKQVNASGSGNSLDTCIATSDVEHPTCAGTPLEQYSTR